MKNLFGFCLIFGIFNLVYALIHFVSSGNKNGTLILGLFFVAGGISGLKIIEMRERQNRH